MSISLEQGSKTVAQTVFLFNAAIAIIDRLAACRWQLLLAATLFVISEICGSFGLFEVQDVLLTYSVLILVFVLGSNAYKNISPVVYICLLLDVTLSSFSIYAGVPACPFLLLFFYVTILITVQCGAVYALALTLALACLHALHIGWIVFAPGPALVRNDQLNQVLGQCVVLSILFILCCVAVAGSIRGRERSHARLVKLSEWPSQPRPSQRGESLAQYLLHAAAIMNTDRILVIYDQANEPFRTIVLLSNGTMEVREEKPEIFGTLVASHLSGSAFSVSAKDHRWWSARRSQVGLLDKDLQRTFRVESVVTAPFSRTMCSGRVLVLDRSQSTKEDVELTKIIASHVGAEIETVLLHSELEALVASKERSRLARDLHDGVLQGLAAANIHLSIGWQHSNDEFHAQVRKAQDIIDREIKHMRALVNQTRPTLADENRNVRLSAELTHCTECLSQQWDCQIDLKSDIEDIVTSTSLSQNITHIVTEAVSNAVRHGGASRVSINVRLLRNCIFLYIRDTGTGFRNLLGTYSIDELADRDAAPHSLCSRIRELGGTLSLTSSPNGADLQIALPA